MKRHGYKLGAWLARCDICGVVYYNDELKEDWRGFRACQKDFETKPAGDKPVTNIADHPEVPWSRPDNTSRTVDSVSIDGHTSWEDYWDIN